MDQRFKQANNEKRLETIQYELSHIGRDVLQNLFPYVICYPLSYMLLKQSIGDTQELSRINQSLSGNVTSEMGLEIGDLADLIRPYPDLKAYLEQADDKTFYDGLQGVDGVEKFKEAFTEFLEKHGHRCPGEIDLTKPRWREAPTQLVPAILGHMRSVQPGEHRRKFTQGEKEANEAIERILNQAGSNGLKRRWLMRLITVCRNAGGLREHPKYFLTRILDECKKAILSEAEKLVEKGVLQNREEAFFLTMDELILLSKGTFQQDVMKLIKERKEAYEWHQTLTPPKVMTSEGECITSSRTIDNLPEGALVGVPASAGVAEGIARVVLKPEEARLQEGEILVAPHTDPGWTPLFQSAKALVIEVGGLMTHGSVVAREYGIPAVVGVDQATKQIQDGQKIRVDGNQGVVEILDDH